MITLPTFSKGTLDRLDDDYFTLTLFYGGSIVLHQTIHESEALRIAEQNSNIIIL